MFHARTLFFNSDKLSNNNKKESIIRSKLNFCVLATISHPEFETPQGLDNKLEDLMKLSYQDLPLTLWKVILKLCQ